MNQQHPNDPNRQRPEASGFPAHVFDDPAQQGLDSQGFPPKPKTMTTGLKVLTGAAITVGVLAIAGIAAAGSGGSAQVAATPQPTTTVTVTAPAEPGAEVTVTAPPVTVTKPAPPAKTVTAAPPEAEAAIDGDGTYEIGVDIQPGKYKTTGGEGCYWARLSNLNGGFEAIIANEFSNGRQTVTVKKSDKGFKTSGCGEWTKVS